MKMKVFDRFINQNPERSVKLIVKIITEYLGGNTAHKILEQAFYLILTKGKEKRKNSQELKYNELILTRICWKVHELFQEKYISYFKKKGELVKF